MQYCCATVTFSVVAPYKPNPMAGRLTPAIPGKMDTRSGSRLTSRGKAHRIAAIYTVCLLQHDNQVVMWCGNTISMARLRVPILPTYTLYYLLLE